VARRFHIARARLGTHTRDFIGVLAAAAEDFTANGYDRAERLTFWQQQLRAAAERSTIPEQIMEGMLRASLRSIYDKMIEHGGILRLHPGIGEFTLRKVKPQLHAELERRVHASAQLIKLNREEMIEKTMRRFSGWATSIPAGGAAEPRKSKNDIKRGIAGLKFNERRVIIDQGHKLTSAISQTIAEGGGALGGYWYSHWRQPGYNYREDHKERDEVFYVQPDNWALNDGLMKYGGHIGIDDQTLPGEEVFCRCFYRYVYNLTDLPDECLTKKGRTKLEEARAYMAREEA
jgi:hypothetical protein